MGTWTLDRKIYAGFGALLCLIVLALGAATLVASRLGQALDETTGHAREAALSWKLGDTVTALRAHQRDSLVQASGGAASAEFDRAKLDRQLDDLVAALRDEEARREAEAAREALHAWLAVNAEVLRTARGGQPDQALRLATSKADPLLGRARASVERLLAGHDASVAGAQRRADGLKRLALTLQGGILLMALGVAVVVGVGMRGVTHSLRRTAGALRTGADQVASASRQVSTSAQALSQGATEQAASLEETSASMEEMSSMTRLNAEHTGQAAALMADVNAQVARSNEALRLMTASMASIQESSARVAKIIKTIDEIAFQTNILALNAAVEAARAGEAGMGFAVVADEVRKLAQRSAQAAKDTASLIEESSRSAQGGAATLAQVDAAISAITASVDQVKALVDQVSTASREQMHGIDQVTQAISQMEKVTQSTAATAEESAAASEELHAQAEITMQAVAELGAMVDQARAVQPGPRGHVAPVPGRAAPPRAAHGAAPPAPPRPRHQPAGRVVPLAPEQVIPFGDEDEGRFVSF